MQRAMSDEAKQGEAAQQAVVRSPQEPQLGNRDANVELNHLCTAPRSSQELREVSPRSGKALNSMSWRRISCCVTSLQILLIS